MKAAVLLVLFLALEPSLGEVGNAHAVKKNHVNHHIRHGHVLGRSLEEMDSELALVIGLFVGGILGGLALIIGGAILLTKATDNTRFETANAVLNITAQDLSFGGYGAKNTNVRSAKENYEDCKERSCEKLADFATTLDGHVMNIEDGFWKTEDHKKEYKDAVEGSKNMGQKTGGIVALILGVVVMYVCPFAGMWIITPESDPWKLLKCIFWPLLPFYLLMKVFCFANTQPISVLRQSGWQTVTMSDIRVGDIVIAADLAKQTTSPSLVTMANCYSKMQPSVRLETETGRAIEVVGEHLLPRVVDEQVSFEQVRSLEQTFGASDQILPGE
jgi:hypothetical protein